VGYFSRFLLYVIAEFQASILVVSA